MLADVHQVGPIRGRNFYDDIVSRASSKGPNLAQKIARHGARLASKLADAKLKFNKSKTVVVASSGQLANEVVAKLKDLGVDIKPVRATKDVGLDAAGGTRRATKTTRPDWRKQLKSSGSPADLLEHAPRL